LSVDQEILRFVSDLKTSDHIIFFYDTLDRKRNILFSFLSSGLANRKGAFYVCSEETPHDIRDRMASFGITVKESEAEGKLVIRDCNEWYFQGEQVESVKILAGWKEACEGFERKGLGLRATGEMAWFFQHDKVKELLIYEYALHRVLDIPMEAICAYNINTIVDTGHTEVIMPLVRAHGWAVFTGPGGNMIYEPENVEDYDIERLLQIRI
jgi:hypothetical protein